MNIHALIPLVATIAYIPLIITTASNRPWQKRHTLFILFLIPAMAWSFADYLFRSNYFPEDNLFLLEFIMIACALMVVQFHCFTSSFYAPSQGRWLPFAYISLVVIVVCVILGYVVDGVTNVDGRLYSDYGIGIILLIVSFLTLAGRNIYALRKKLKMLDNPVAYNQTITLILSIIVLTVFISGAVLPWGREYSIPHIGNLINAFILTYAVIRHNLVDIRIVLRQGSAWFGLGVIGVVTYWFILVVAHHLFDFEISLTASFAATIAGILVAILVYRLRGYFFSIMSRAFHGASYNHRQELSNFTDTIHNVFSLKEQGGELLALLVKAIGIRQAVLLFPQTGSDEFCVQIAEPKNNELTTLKLKANNPIVKYLARERKPLTKENLSIMPEFLGLWSQEKEELDSKEMEILMPLISRDRLIAILILGKKKSGRYSLEEYNMIINIADRVAVSMEKEYLSELLRAREAELSVINNCSVIVSSSLNIQEIFGSFIEELRKVVDVDWASIVLVEEGDLCCVALSSKEGSAYQVGEKFPITSTGTCWVVEHKKPLVIADLSKDLSFSTQKNFYEQGMLSMVYLPLIAKGEVIGSFILASRRTDAYSQQHLNLLEQLASQIAMPLENARLYAETEEKARVDELTGLLNRRSLDEMIDSEISRHSRYGGSFTLAILDLDKFKSFNDTKGHLAGDNLLGKVGAIIKNVIRTSDYAFRYGGDEFAILLPQTTIEAASQVTERVRESIANELETGDINVTASIGLASWPEDGMSHSDVIAAADLTLYRAKWSGGNRILCASGTLSNLYFAEAGGYNREGNNRTISIIYNLAETIDSRNPHTRNHSKKVAEYASALAKSLDINALEIRNLENCALLHDIGKISISDEILDKTDGLTDKEWEIVRSHPQLGANIVGHIPKLAKCVDGIRHHHEWYDGTGYPSGLKGDNIPLEARILAIANTFDILLTADNDDSAINMALEEIKRFAGTKFDPYLVDKFVAIYEKKPVKTGE
jgi:diguanylate cyclase (GGDEF)-like protein/putative nucleotidyltransferase with HDIG domain